MHNAPAPARSHSPSASSAPLRERLLPALLCCLFLSLPLLTACQSLDNRFGSRRNPTPPDPRAARNNGRAPAVNINRVETANAAVVSAQAAEAAGDYEKALADFERAIAHNPRMTVAYLGAGDIHLEQGNFAAAEKHFAKAADLEPRNFDAQYRHGLSLQLLSRLEDAVRAYLRALNIKGDDFNANLNLGTAYLQLNEASQALPYAERAVRIDGKNAAARSNLGAIYATLGRHDDAIVEFQQAAELTQLTGPLLLNLANSLSKVGRHEEAVNTLEQLARTEPTAPCYERLGVGYFNLRRYDTALSSFRKSLEIDPNYYPALNGVGVCLLNQWMFSGQADRTAHDDGLKALRRSLQIERDQPAILELVSRYK
ncbi:MAG TPA: tetratricopeptide repeat protein [Phycisphaerales bacterium]|nr:tetratricopeptide repeat protein [Phycisphaerales bacterium]